MLLEVLGRRLVLASVVLVVSVLELALALPACACEASFADGDVLGVVEGEAREVLDGLGLGRREEEGLARFGEVGDDGVDGGGEAHVEDPVRFVEHLHSERVSSHLPNSATREDAPRSWR